MTDKLGLTFGILIAHFIPGLISFLSLIASSYSLDEIECFITNNSTFAMILGALLSLACGLSLDSIRYLLTVVPKLSKSYKLWSEVDPSTADEDSRKYFDWVIEHHFRFHQFYGNLSLALVFSAIVLHVNKTTLCNLWPLYLLSIICALAALVTYHTTITQLKKRFFEKL